MTEQKEFESLDELFRKTFDNLPETPAKSGWDTPSERVWQHVQEKIKPPQTGWSAQKLTLLAAFAVTITVGLYLLLNRPAEPEIPVTSPPAAVATEQPATDNRETLTDVRTVAPEAEVAPAKTKRKKTGVEEVPSRNLTQTGAAESAPADSFAEKPAEQERKVPNTTLRRKAELAKRAEQAWKTPLRPLPQRWPDKPEK